MLGGITANTTQNELRNKIIKLAYQMLNKPYVHGSHGPDDFDCAGLVWYLYNNILDIDIYEGGIGLSTTTKIMTSKYGIITLFDKNDISKNIKLIKKGDIVFFHRQSLKDNEPNANNKYPGHCGIYIGDNSFIHSSIKGHKTSINTLEEKYWNKVLVANKDIISNYEKKC